tara:strand:+ start:4 stop:426 length:423 start_codon:yes stop_codon:yes gene_type:complete
MHLIILGNPRPLKRHRHSRWGTYDPSKKEKDDFARKVKSEYPDKPLENPLFVTLHFFLKRPKSHYGTGKNSHIVKESSPKEHMTKPDVDNLIKFVLDSCNEILWTDDRIITILLSRKYYVDDGFSRTEIIVTDLKNEPNV